MNLLLDTHVLLWAAAAPERIPAETQDLLNNPDHQLYFSPAAFGRLLSRTG